MYDKGNKQAVQHDAAFITPRVPSFAIPSHADNHRLCVFVIAVLGIRTALCIDRFCRTAFFLTRFLRGKRKTISYI